MVCGLVSSPNIIIEERQPIVDAVLSQNEDSIFGPEAILRDFSFFSIF